MSKKITDENGKTYVEKKPFYKKGCFWIIAVVVVIIIGAVAGSGSGDSDNGGRRDGDTFWRFPELHVPENG